MLVLDTFPTKSAAKRELKAAIRFQKVWDKMVQARFPGPAIEPNPEDVYRIEPIEAGFQLVFDDPSMPDVWDTRQVRAPRGRIAA